MPYGKRVSTTLNPRWLKVERSRNLVHGQFIFMEVPNMKFYRMRIACGIEEKALAVTHPSPAPMRYAALTHPTQELQVI